MKVVAIGLIWFTAAIVVPIVAALCVLAVSALWAAGCRRVWGDE